VVCDVDVETACVSAETVRAALTPRTKAVVAVHLFGNVAPVSEIEALGVPVVEDAAQAAGASLDGVRAGALGDAATFSFFPSKNLGGFGDGGAIVTDDDEVAAMARTLRFHGSEDKVVHTEVGYNSRLDEMQAAGLRVLLPHLTDWTEARRGVAAAYADNGLGDAVELPVETAGGESCYHLYVVRCPERDRLGERLEAAGIGARAYYSTPLHRQPALREFAPSAPLPGVDSAASQSLALPMGPALTAEQATEVSRVTREVFASS
jgi:dTDP-4-amino-4,6-dideoxygalactose transaminase